MRNTFPTTGLPPTLHCQHESRAPSHMTLCKYRAFWMEYIVVISSVCSRIWFKFFFSWCIYPNLISICLLFTRVLRNFTVNKSWRVDMTMRKWQERFKCYEWMFNCIHWSRGVRHHCRKMEKKNVLLCDTLLPFKRNKNAYKSAKTKENRLGGVKQQKEKNQNRLDRYAGSLIVLQYHRAFELP